MTGSTQDSPQPGHPEETKGPEGAAGADELDEAGETTGDEQAAANRAVDPPS